MMKIIDVNLVTNLKNFCIPETVPEHGTIMSLLSVSLPSLRGTLTSALEVEALLDLFTL